MDKLRVSLQEKADILKHSSYFTHNTDGAELHDKQSIYLVLAGLKPVSEAASSHMVWVADNRRVSVPDDVSGIQALLEQLGLFYSLHKGEHYIRAVVSLNPHLVSDYDNAKTSAEFGRLLGYPPTATAAYSSTDRAELLPPEELEQLRHERELPFAPGFWLSRSHCKEEIKIIECWHEALTEVGLV